MNQPTVSMLYLCSGWVIFIHLIKPSKSNQDKKRITPR